jgi:TrmH family RNA methyltransferase
LTAKTQLDRLRVVLVATRNPLNIGAAARAMSNFGFTHLRLVNPYEKAFREAKSAVGASAVLRAAEEYQAVAEAVADCALVVGTTAVRHRELQHPLRRLEEGARLIRRQLRSKPVAILFGSEKVGLSNHDLSHCHWLLRIPTIDQHISMNLGQAVAVCLYELIRDSRASAAVEKRVLATAGEQERVTKLLLELLTASAYMIPSRAASTEEKVRRLIRRYKMSSLDAELWQGILRQIAWKLRSCNDSSG